MAVDTVDLDAEEETAGFGERVKNVFKKLDPRTGEGPTVVKLLLYAGICLTLLVALVVQIGNRALFSDRAGYSAQLEDVTGLFNSDSVRISGVPVGRVTGIKVEDGLAHVDFEIDDHIELPSDTEVGVRWRNVLGQKYLYLYPGESTTMLEPGSTISVEQSRNQADFGRFLNEIGPVLRAVDPEDGNAFVQAFAEALNGNEQKVKELFADAAVVTGTVGELDTELGTIITQLEDLLTAIAQRDGDLVTIIDDLGLTAETLADNNQLLIEVIASFTEVQEQLRSMLEGNRVEIDSLIENLVVIGDTLDANLASLELGLSTMPTGLTPYHEISAQGQWFNVRARILCFAGQTTCTSEDLSHSEPIFPTSGAGADAGPASSPAGTSAPRTAQGEAPGGYTVAGSPLMSESVNDWLQQIRGEGS